MLVYLPILTLVLKTVAGQAWWESAVYYRLLVDSFKDGDGDGLGDLKGATKQLSYVKALGADAIILSSLSTKSTDCNRPGPLDLTDIDQRYGNLDQLNEFLEKAKKLELKVVITLPLTTISSASEWFHSSAEKSTGYEDRILWRDGTIDDTPQPENNTTWSWNEVKSAYYAVLNEEAVLNLCSESVTAALAFAQCAWLRRGVDGVVLNPDFRETECGFKLVRKMAVEALSCVRAASLDTPVIVVETSLTPNLAAKYYAAGGAGASCVISRALTSIRGSATEMALAFYADLLNTPEERVPAWVTSNPTESRITSRLGSDMTDAINLFSLILPGAAIIQQGDELGAADTILEWATTNSCYPNSPTSSAAPFPWDDTVNGGFTTGEPWLPLAQNYRYANAKAEFGNDVSHVGVVRVAAAMRKSPAFGAHAEIKCLNGALAILRWGNSGSLLLVSNVEKTSTEIQLSRISGLPAEMTVAAASSGSSLSTGSHVITEKTMKLAAAETMLLAGSPRHCGGPGPVDKIANKLTEGWQKLNKYFSNM